MVMNRQGRMRPSGCHFFDRHARVCRAGIRIGDLGREPLAAENKDGAVLGGGFESGRYAVAQTHPVQRIVAVKIIKMCKNQGYTIILRYLAHGKWLKCGDATEFTVVEKGDSVTVTGDGPMVQEMFERLK